MIYEHFLTLADAAAQASPASSSSPAGGTTMIIYMVCFGVIFYFMIIRPQSQKQKQQQTLISSVKTGDKVVTSGGIHGLVSNVKETTVIVKIADNVKIEIDKTSITSVTKRSESEAATAA